MLAYRHPLVTPQVGAGWAMVDVVTPLSAGMSLISPGPMGRLVYFPSSRGSLGGLQILIQTHLLFTVNTI